VGVQGCGNILLEMGEEKCDKELSEGRMGFKLTRIEVKEMS